MKKRNTADSPSIQSASEGQMYILRFNGFWGTLIAIAVLLLILPLVMAFLLFFVVGFVAVAVIGMGYAWWKVRKLRGMRSTGEEKDVIELTESEYHALEETRVTTRDPEGKDTVRG